MEKVWNGILLLLIISSVSKNVNCKNDLNNLTKGSETYVVPFNITTKNFQLNFLHELMLSVDRSAQQHLNAYLWVLHESPVYAQHKEDFDAVEQSIKVKHKIVFIKQLLDEKINEGKSIENQIDLQTLRNVIFLKKLKHQLHDLHEEKLEEIRQMRIYEICRQFREIKKQQAEPPFSKSTLLEPFQTTPIMQSPRVIAVNLENFGKELYERIKNEGASIINDFLIIIRKLLHDVIEEKHENVRDQPKISKLLNVIDHILHIPDFNDKRQELYAYLGNNITVDYEQFKNSEHTGQDLIDILAKLKQRGFDLFVNFLFSNFEFLEQLHSELYDLLQKIVDVDLSIKLDNNGLLLYNVHKTFLEFKADSENEQKYDDYMHAVKELLDLTINKPAFAKVNIYEMLRDSSENVGSVTLNMIRGKCAEL